MINIINIIEILKDAFISSIYITTIIFLITILIALIRCLAKKYIEFAKYIFKTIDVKDKEI